jgi:DNA-binding GntR family transcriptional regulator
VIYRRLHTEGRLKPAGPIVIAIHDNGFAVTPNRYRPNEDEGMAPHTTDGLGGRSAAASRGFRGPVQRPAPLRHVVFDALVELIISRALTPGEHLAEAELAEELGVSRQPVREALQSLQAEGWVDLRPGQGAFVHAPTHKEADDLFAVRTLLEAQAARLAAATRTDADVVRLWEIWSEGMQAVSSHDTEKVVSANATLHAYVMSIAGNAALADLARQVERRVRWYFTPLADSRGVDSWDEHAELIRAIAAGDQERTGDVMRQHTERTRAAAQTPTVG